MYLTTDGCILSYFDEHCYATTALRIFMCQSRQDKLWVVMAN